METKEDKGELEVRLSRVKSEESSHCQEGQFLSGGINSRYFIVKHLCAPQIACLVQNIRKPCNNTHERNVFLQMLHHLEM